MNRKGLELPFSEMFVGFVFLGVAVLIYLLLYSRIVDVHVVLAEYEADIHTINLAQVLLSSDLAYSNAVSKTVQRGVFDKEKLDAGLLGNMDIWYPDAIAIVEIEDLETGKVWTGKLIPRKIGGTTATEFLSCLSDTYGFDLSSIFRLPCFIDPTKITCGWEWPDLYKCFTQEVASDLAPSKRDFSVAIRVSDNEIHSGKMTISLREMTFGVVT